MDYLLGYKKVIVEWEKSLKCMDCSKLIIFLFGVNVCYSNVCLLVYLFFNVKL